MSKTSNLVELQRKIDQLNQLAWEVRVYDSPQSFKLSEEAISLSKKINYKRGLAGGMQGLGFCHIRLSNNKEALPLIKESLALFEELGDPIGQSCGHEYQALIQRNWGDFGGAIKLLFKALEFAERAGAKENIATITYQLGVTYKYLGKFEKSLEYLDKSLNLYNEIGKEFYGSYPINVIGSVYFENGDYHKALEYYEKGLWMRQAAHDKWGEAGSLDNVGFTYLKLKNYKQAIEHCSRSLEISQSTDDKRSQGNALIHLAEIFKEAGDIEKAISFSNESLKIRESTGDKRGQTEILLFLAELHGSHTKDTVQKAGDWLSTALRIAEEMKAIDLVSRTRYQLYEHYKKMGQPLEAMSYLASHVELEKQLHKNNIDQKVTNLEISRKAEEARKETEQVRQRNRELTDLNNEIARQKQELVSKNRELEIESALERVRSKAMAMHKSDDLNDAVAVVFDQLRILDLGVLRCGIGIMNKEKRTADVWVTTITIEGCVVQVTGDESFDIHPLLHGAFDAWVEQKDYSYVLKGEDMVRYYKSLGSTNFHLPESQLILTSRPEEYQQHYFVAMFEAGGLFAFHEQECPDETKKVLKRFAGVFNLTYQRFLDIQKAEAQVRESKIEASLERVRAKAMGMHSSEDLMDTINLFYNEVQLLSVTPRRCGVSLVDKWNKTAELSSMTTTRVGDAKIVLGTLKLVGHPVLESAFEHWELQQEFHPVLRGKEIEDYYNFISGQIGFQQHFEDEVQYGYSFSFPEGFVFVWTNEELEEKALSIYRRFTSVLNLTYKRYKELKDAEERALARLEDFKKLEEAKNKTEAALNELKATQSQLIQAEKMASLGELTAGIAHEIQNPLNFVNNFSEVNAELLDELNEQLARGNMLEAKELAKDLRDNEAKINHHGKRADAIVKSMLQHSRVSGGKQELTDINSLVDEYLRLAYHGLRAKDNSFNAILETELDPAVGKLNVVPQDIGRVLINLINNAFYAVSERKKSQGQSKYEPMVRVLTKKGMGTVEIVISDNGDGIPSASMEKIFQPFFTTKPTGQGTGLGLSLSYDIIKAHGGELKVGTNEGHGSDFTILLPTGSKESI